MKMFLKHEIDCFFLQKSIVNTVQNLAVYMNGIEWQNAPKIENLTVLESWEYVENEKNIFETHR